MSETVIDDVTMRPGERAHLRSLVRMRVKVLRSQIGERHASSMSQIDQRVAAKFQEDKDRVEALRAELDRIVARANQAADTVLAKYSDVAEPRSNVFSRPWIPRPDQGRDKLRKALIAGVTAQTEAAKRRVAELEAELLSALALTAVQTEEAKAFVRSIPEIGELMPGERLVEIEAKFDAERAATDE